MSDGRDEGDYPTELELEAIRVWPYKDVMGWFAFIKEHWHMADWGWTESTIDDDAGLRGRGPYTRWQISTGGWSGNEDIVAAMQANRMLWMLSWYNSRRGGHFEFRARPL